MKKIVITPNFINNSELNKLQILINIINNNNSKLKNYQKIRISETLFKYFGIEYNIEYNKLGHLNVEIFNCNNDLMKFTENQLDNEIYLFNNDNKLVDIIKFDYKLLGLNDIKYIQVCATLKNKNLNSLKFVLTVDNFKKKPLALGNRSHRYYLNAHNNTLFFNGVFNVKKMLTDNNIPTDIKNIFNKALEKCLNNIEFNYPMYKKHEFDIYEFENFENPNNTYHVWGTNNITYQGITHTSNECMCEYCQLD